MLFNEPKLLKCKFASGFVIGMFGFSALQRAEIAEIWTSSATGIVSTCFSALQRAEIAEINNQSAEPVPIWFGFSALQRAEIAEIVWYTMRVVDHQKFQCSSTSRNC